MASPHALIISPNGAGNAGAYFGYLRQHLQYGLCVDPDWAATGDGYTAAEKKDIQDCIALIEKIWRWGQAAGASIPNHSCMS
ncbi:hypothetical protein D3C87_1481150 [compost metagenome]